MRRVRGLKIIVVLAAIAVLVGVVMSVAVTGATGATHGPGRVRLGRHVGGVPLVLPAEGQMSAAGVSGVRPVVLSAAQKRRIAVSRVAYAHLTPARALALAKDESGAVGQARKDFFEPLMLQRGDHLLGFVNAREAAVRVPASRTVKGQRAGGQIAFAESTEPMYVQHGHSRSVVNLDLHRLGNGTLAPVTSRAPVTFGANRISFSSVGISATLAGARPTVLDNLGEDGFAASVFKDTDVVDEATSTGAEQWLQLRSPDSPSAFAFDLKLPKGARAQLQPDGWVAAFKAKRLVLEIAPVVATDALGRAVQARMSVWRGHVVVVRVEHSGADVAYPVTVDPVFIDPPGANSNVQDPFNYIDQETPNGSGTFEYTGPNGTPDPFAQWTYHSSVPADFVNQLNPTAFGSEHGAGEGLYTYPNTSPPSGGYAELYYTAPAGAYIGRVDFDGTAHTLSSTGSSDLEEGIIQGNLSAWDSETVGDANNGTTTTTNLGAAPYLISAARTTGAQAFTLNNPSDADDGNIAVFGLVLTKAGTRTLSTPDIGYMAGATVWLYDDTAPTWNPWSVPSSSFTWTDDGAQTYTIAPSASDTGLGVKQFQLGVFNAVTGGADGYTSYVSNCSGDHTGTGYCLKSLTGSIAYKLPEGEDQTSVAAQDVLENQSPVLSWDDLIDRSPPTVALSGQLYAGQYSATNTGGSSPSAPLTGSSYRLDISATDAGSGVAEIDVSVDGQPATVFDGNCRTSVIAPASLTNHAGCDTTDTVQYMFNSDLYPDSPANTATKHTITVTVKDWLGTSLFDQPGMASHVTTETFYVYTNPAVSLAGLSGQSQLQTDSLGMEKFYAYHSTDTGDGSALSVNEGTGNAVWNWTPISEPGQGIDTNVQLTYNSQQHLSDLSAVGSGVNALLDDTGYDQAGLGWSISVDGLTRLNDPLDLSQEANGLISYTDPSGATHTFSLQGSGSSAQWFAPPGLFLHLRQWTTPGTTGYNWNRTWAITATDGTTYFFDGLGYESAIQDRVGNTVIFNRTFVSPLSAVTGTLCANAIGSTLITTLSNLLSSATGSDALGAGCAEETTSVQDEGSVQATLANPSLLNDGNVDARELTISYQSPNVVSPITQITDRAGQSLSLGYETLENNQYLTTVTQGTGPTARPFAFSYGGPTPALSSLAGLLNVAGLGGAEAPSHLTSIEDPRLHTTSISYNGGSSGTTACPSAASATAGSSLLASLSGLEPICVGMVTDRNNGQTSFAYDVSNPNACASGAECTQVTGPQTDDHGNQELWFASLDSSLRPVQTVDPLGRETQTTWNNVAAPGVNITTVPPANTVAQSVTGEVAAGYSTQATPSNPACEAYTYDQDGDVLTDQGPSEGTTCPTSPFRETTYTYNLSGGPKALQATGSSDSSGMYVSDLASKTVNSAAGPEVTSYTYDLSDPADGLVTQIQQPDGDLETISYYTGSPNADDVDGGWQGLPTDDFGGGLIESETEDANAQTGFAGNTTDYGNAVGQFTSGPLASNDGYDPNGQPELVYQPGQYSSTQPSTSTPSVYQYDADGNLIAATDPRYWTNGTPAPTSISLLPGADTVGNGDAAAPATPTTPFTDYSSYDQFDDQVESWTAKDTAAGAAGTWTTNITSYDANGNVASSVVGAQLTNGANSTPSSSPAVTTTYSYTNMDQQDAQNVLNVPSSEASSSGGSTQTTTYCYDLNGFETDEVLPAGQSSATPCSGGLALANNQPSGTTHAVHYVLDADGDRLVTEQVSSELNGQTQSTDQLSSYVYDAAGNQVASADPADNNGACVPATPGTCTSGGAIGNAQSALTTPNSYGPWRTRTSYDAAGETIETVENPSIETGANSYTPYDSFDQYDAAGNLIASQSAKDVQAEGAPTLNTATGQYQIRGVLPHVTSYLYDQRNLLVSETNPDLDTTEYGRYPDGKICWIMSPDGVQYQNKQASPQLNNTSCTVSQTTQPYTTGYGYTQQGWVSTITLPEAPNEYQYPAGEMQVGYSYDLVGDPKTITDPNGQTITNQFYDTGDLKQTSAPWWWTADPSGNSSQSGPDPNTGGSGQVSGATPSQGVVQQRSLNAIFEADDQASSSSPSLPSDGISGQLGDVSASPLPGLLPNAGSTQFGYDGQMQLTSVAGPEAISDGQTYATANSLLITYLSYDPDGNLTQLIQPFTGTQSTGSPDTSTTTYSYDPDGNLLKETTPAIANASSLSQYAASGGSQNGTGPGAAQTAPTTTYTYDGLDRLQSVTAPGAGVSDSNSSPTSNTTQYCYYIDPTGSAAGGTNESACPSDHGAVYGSTAPLAVSEPGGVSVAVAQRVLSINAAGQGSTVDYDADGNELASTDPLGNETAYGYDQIGDQTSVTRPKGTPGLGTSSTFGSTLTAPAAAYTTTNTYDQAGLLTGSVDGSNDQSTYTYDASGNMTSQSVPGAGNSTGGTAVPEVTDYTYNGRGLLWTETTGAGGLGTGTNSDGQTNARTTVYETDGDGNVVRTVNPSGVAAGGLPYYGYNQDYSTAGYPTNTSTTATQNDEANIDATINVYDANNQLQTQYLPWGCDLSSNSSKIAGTSPVCSTTAATSADPRRWTIDYTRTSPATANGDWIGAVTQAYQWTAPTNSTAAPVNATTSYFYLPNGWLSQQIGPTYQAGTAQTQAGTVPVTDQDTSDYTYDADGDEIDDHEVPAITTGTGSTASITFDVGRNLWRSYWPDGQLQQLAGYGNNNAEHTYDYYWNQTGQLNEVAVGSTPNQVFTQTPADRACYDADDRVQRVYQTVSTPAGTTPYDTFYAYDADGNETARDANGTQPITASSPLCGSLAQGAMPSAYGGGELTSFSYDSLDRQHTMTVTANAGDSLSEPQRTYTNSYWPSGALENQTRSQASGTGTATQSWAYNDDGSVASTTTNDAYGSANSPTSTQSYSYDTDGNVISSANGTHLYNALDQEVQWTRGGTNTANSGATVNYLYDGDGALMQETTNTPSVSIPGAMTGVSQQTTTLFCSSTSTPTTTSGESASNVAGTAQKPQCALDNGRAENVYSYATTTATALGMSVPVNATPATQDYCYDDRGDLTEEVEQATDTCSTTTPTPATSSVFGYNVFGQQVSSTVPFSAVLNGSQTYSTTTSYDPLGRNVYQTQTVSGQASTPSTFGYLGLSTDVSTSTGTTANGTGFTDINDYDSAGEPVGLYVSAPTSSTGGTGYYSYLLSPTGSVLGLEGSNGQIATDDEYHYTPTGELELGSNQFAISLSDPFGNQDPDSILSTEAQANQTLFDGYQYNQGNAPEGSPAGTPSSDSYSAPARTYLPGSDAWDSPDTFSEGSAEQALATTPSTQELYAFDGGNPTSADDADGHMTAYGQGVGQTFSAQGDTNLEVSDAIPGTSPGSYQGGSHTTYTNGTVTSTEVDNQEPVYGDGAQQIAAVVNAVTTFNDVVQQVESNVQSGNQDPLGFDNHWVPKTELDQAGGVAYDQLQGASHVSAQVLHEQADVNQLYSELGGRNGTVGQLLEVVGLLPETGLAVATGGGIDGLIGLGADALFSGGPDLVEEALGGGSGAAEDAAGGGVDDLDGALCGGQSFTRNTKVKLSSGRAVSIADLRVGEHVLATDTTTGQTRAERVTAVWVDRDADLLDLFVRGRRDAVIRTTRRHLFYDATRRRWAQAERLWPGQRLRGIGRTPLTVVAARVVRGSGAMWDLTIARDHDFYVVAGDSTALVHNCPAPGSVPPDLDNLSPKILRQMEARGFTPEQIQDAYENGEQVPAINRANGEPSTRYVNPDTGQSVVIQNGDGQVIHVGGPGFEYGPGSGDLPR